jgi:hypothetical protein
MKHTIKLVIAALLLTLNLQPTNLLAQSTAFTYQGRLNSGTNPVTGIFDLEFAICSTASGGSPNIAVTNAAVPVTNGLFTALVDFGAAPSSFATRWLEISVRTNGGTGGFVTLAPRQQLTATPYAFVALTAGNLTGPAGTATNFTGALGGDVNGPQDATVVASVGGQTAASIASGTLAVNAATDAATPGTLVKRDATGSFQAQDLTLNGNLNLPTTTTSAGMITLGGSSVLQAYGYDNIFAGQGAGNLTMSGFYNTAIGAVSFNNNSSGNGNTAIGCYALFANSSGDHNTAMGMSALYQNTSGFANTANGFSALHYNTSGCNNTAMGYEALLFNHTGAYNTAGGVSALVNNQDGSDNTANGFETLVANVSGSDNTADGYQALYFNASGSDNIALGCQAGYNLTTGSNNIDIGNLGVAGEGGVIRLGTPGNQFATYIAGTINGDGGGLTHLNAINLTGVIPAGQLSGTAGDFSATNITVIGSITGNGANLTNVDAAAVNGMTAADFWQLGGNNVAAGQFLGGTNDQPVEVWAGGQRGLRLEPNTNGAPNLIGGSPMNYVAPGVNGATISGGGAITIWNGIWDGYAISNSVTSDFGTISGGFGNTVNGVNATVGGGYRSVASGDDATVAGGGQNTASAYDTTVAGGENNFASAESATVGGGENNEAAGNYATVPGGILNYAGGEAAVAMGKFATANGEASFAMGNTTTASGYCSSALGANTLASGDYSIAMGDLNSVTSDFGTIGGGLGNVVNGEGATVGGGYKIVASGDYATVGGGNMNTASDFDTTVAGGENNAASGDAATVGGGEDNQATATDATVPGGILNVASGEASVAMGKVTTASGEASVAMGNTTTASGYCSSALGANTIASGDYSTAMGYYAQATNNGCLVWADNSGYNSGLASINDNSATFRASGGYRLFSNSGMTAGVSLAPGGTAWAVLSDRNAKKDFAPVDSVAILEKLAAMSVTQWHYKWEETNITPHIGPMAQDFKAAFYPGSDDKSITTLEADGVAFAAIQGLNRKVEEQLKAKDAEIQALKARLEKLEQLMAEKTGGGQ